ncbi:universal stress protein [Streptomyces sp. 7R007]
MSTSVRAPIVVVIGPGLFDRAALLWGAAEADRRHLPLRVVHAQGRPSGRDPSAVLHDAVEVVADRHPQLEVSTLYAVGSPTAALREQTHSATAVVLGLPRPGTHDEPFTSACVALPVTGQAGCPVVVVRGAGHTGRQQPYVVVGADAGWDGRHHSTAALDCAFEEAALWGAELRVLYVWHPPLLGVLDEQAALRECHRLLSEAVASHQAAHPDVEVRHWVVRGRPARVLPQESAEALALVLGRSAHGGLTGVLVGSVLRGALRHARCPLVAVPWESARRLPCTRQYADRVRSTTGQGARLLTRLTRDRVRAVRRGCRSCVRHWWF